MQTEYIIKAIDAALAAGKEILEVYYDPNSDFQVERKADQSPLTLADRRAHDTIMNYLRDTDYPVLSEEGRHLPYEERSRWDTLWIVDPLDGTKEFIKRNGEFTVNIALVERKIPVFGVIYVPVTKTLYWGEPIAGAYKMEGVALRDGRSLEEMKAAALRLPCAQTNESFVMVASRSHLSAETADYVEQKRKMYPHVELVSVGSSIKICKVSEGVADEYPRFAPTMEWDTAAGHAIAKAAGAEIYQVGKEEPLVYNKLDLLNPWFIVKRD
ncbi:MAG: 3'(2'),5'-bisphosphate nucleotidase CysQ [Phocaeicola sp.]|uniref:3'(2'),5'-bisphosphate nucleotidase CysQ n=1 Tax=Phocaeicola sp. TaxID=2773926 RepID=UPI0023BFE8E2|nr:3'(2'),5'-bisphosphate nucleotidase CysQ [Phocaeicola sp.]MDE5677246.1 3'(2'),5'-bisphosphate nucleotidase CysQ [Phocaeicola sp.]MDE6181162.1 3'(2'),5'-bisphosphate nucleotidase CysQ [Phocaeicola sp.]